MQRRQPAATRRLALVLGIGVIAMPYLVNSWQEAGTGAASPADAHHHDVVPAAAMEPFARPLPRAGWVVSEDAGRSITVDMRRVHPVSGLRYTPRGNAIERYEIRLSPDGRTWSAPVATGTLADDTETKTLQFATAHARMVRLTALSTARPAEPVGAAQIDVLGSPPASTDKAGKAVRAPGAWDPVIGFPIVPAAAAVLPNGKLLTWSAVGSDYSALDSKATQTAVLDPITRVVGRKQIDDTGHEMFCPGVSRDPDGRVVVTGGSDANKTSVYDPGSDRWSVGPAMNVPRGYHGQVTLSNGDTFLVGGSWHGGLGGKSGEVLSRAENTWRMLPGVSPDPFLTRDPGGVYRQDNHAWLFAASRGRVFHAGPSTQLNWVSTAGEGSVTLAGIRGGIDAVNGNAVMYDIDKILTVGGATAYENADATTDAYVMDIGGPAPVVHRTGGLNVPRTFINSVVLPDGKVITFGGMRYAELFADRTAVLEPEMWDPATGAFTTLAPAAVPRAYHSVAVLLPDGRVFSGGGGLCGQCATNHPDGQIFTPPNLLDAEGRPKPRPVITEAPGTVAPGDEITVRADRPIAGLALVRAGGATHTVDNDQRRVPLAVAGVSDNQRVAVPGDPGIVPPGYYMLFALDEQGTPSVSAPVFVR
ncbi:galactose oxidase [Herbihabitans rhizosphaerae]|uniref:Galactose oxidase n=1 Tax=Herbihabitans rhizosphaerae TaxID=1872711 RepID=A0A4Q7L492_9PSEU|nr:galactose oxidase-like domain-containing protein [Herbihabitans rhizosphaerae]RZS44438.1 galactose oxidase [Herbihabitans rhizosphaerae]